MPTAEPITFLGRVAQDCRWPGYGHRLHPRRVKGELHRLKKYLPHSLKNTGCCPGTRSLSCWWQGMGWFAKKSLPCEGSLRAADGVSRASTPM